MFPRPSFGTPQTSGFGGFQAQTSAAPFGQTQLFGNTSSSSFGTTNAFGNNSAPVFGQAQSSAPLFGGTTTTPAFGQPQTGFGTSLFGQQQQQPAAGGLFGNTNTFGQQSKPTGFGYASTPTTGLFGQPAQPQNSLFQTPATNNVFGTSSFGNNMQQGMTGTVVKFTPITSTDSMQRGGIAHTINTKHHCITIMKEYENKSFEELRYEDYQAGRKGPQQQSGFGAPQAFGPTASTAPSLFGQADQNKSVFGQSGFGQTTGFGGVQPTAQPFGKPSTSTFGTTVTTASSFGFGAQPAANVFGSTNANKPAFGAQPTLFATPAATQPSAFGSTFFGQPATQTTAPLFGKSFQQQPAFGQPAATSSGFQFGQTQPTQTSTLFQQPKPATGFGFSFGQPGATTATPALGQQPQQQPAFGGFSNTFGKSFGQTQQPTQGFGTGIGGMQNISLFGNNAPKPLFGNTTGTTGTFNQPFSTTFGLPQQQQALQQFPAVPEAHHNTAEEMQKLVAHFDVYGQNKALEGLTPIKAKEQHYVTNPKDIQAILDQPIGGYTSLRESPKIKVLPPKIKTRDIFGTSQDDSADRSYYMRSTSTRRLVLKNKPDEVVQKMDEVVAKCLLGQFSDLPATTSSTSLTQESKPVEKEKPKAPNEPGTSGPAISTPKEKAEKAAKQIVFTKEDEDKSDDEPAFEDAVGDSDEADKGTTRYMLRHLDEELDKASIYTAVAPVGFETVLRENKSVSTDNSCGVKLTRQGYFTIPPLDTLHEFVKPDGRCLITGLTIGRLGFGNVYYPNEVDVTGLDLDAIVHFEHRVLTVYPDDNNKPEVGKELNQEAQITLDNVYPKNSLDNEIIHPQGEDLESFIERLETVTARIGGQFKSYRADTGSWVFNVPHFTKYGIDDAETKCSKSAPEIPTKRSKSSIGISKPLSIESDLTASPKQREAHKYKPITIPDFRPSLESVTTISAKTIELSGVGGSSSSMGRFILESNFDLENSCLSQFESGTGSCDTMDTLQEEEYIAAKLAENIVDTTSAPEHWKSEIAKSDSDTVYLMKNTLFRKDSQSTLGLLEEGSDDTEAAESGSGKDIESGSGDSPHSSVVPQAMLIDETLPRIEFDPLTGMEFYKLINMGGVPLHKSYHTGRNYMDMGVFKGRSMKPGWTGASTIYSKLPITVESNVKSSTLATMQIYKPQSDIFDIETLDKHMKIVLKYSEIELINSTPHSTVIRTKRLLEDHWELAQNYPNTEQGAYYKSIWDLMEAFWDKESNRWNRKERFSAWLEDIVNEDVQTELILNCRNVEDITSNILTLLSGHQVEKAASLAMENEMPQLSLLISQLNSTTYSKNAMHKQLKDWFKSLAADEIDTVVFKIYSILAGITNTEKANICEALDWKRALAMHLWYIAPTCKPISFVLAQYDEAFKNQCYAKRPSPQYNEEETETCDVLYHIMQLHINKTRSLERILNTATYTSDPTDYTLSWFLLTTFESLQLGTISEGAINQIHINFATQLEALGLYNWAIFVLSFVKDQSVRKNLIMRVLYRHVDTENSNVEMESELVNELCVSSLWIHYIKGNKCVMDKRYWEAYTHLSLTQRWLECHDIAMQHLLPTLLVNEQYEEMKIILYPIASGCDKIPNWKHQGGLMLDFIQLREMVQTTTPQEYSERYLDVNEEIITIVRRFGEFPTATPELALCRMEMCRRCLAFLNKFLINVSPMNASLLEAANSHFGELCLPSDQKIEFILSALRKNLQAKFAS